MYLMGLTGSVGMGKTQTAALFEEKACRAMTPMPPCMRFMKLVVHGRAVGEMFPEAVRDGAVDRAALGNCFERFRQTRRT